MPSRIPDSVPPGTQVLKLRVFKIPTGPADYGVCQLLYDNGMSTTVSCTQRWKALREGILQGTVTKDVWHRARSFPPGTYRITKTLVFQGPAVGCLVIGHGRDTRLVWDGPQGGRMFWSNGVAYSRYVGLSWDGRGKAAVGFDHAAQERFETEVRHKHEAFRNFTEYGIRVGYQQKVASAEILYRNCLFENCGTGLAFLTFNDYDNTIDGCEFRNCGTGVLDNKGNFYARNCHFEGSRQVDFREP